MVNFLTISLLFTLRLKCVFSYTNKSQTLRPVASQRAADRFVAFACCGWKTTLYGSRTSALRGELQIQMITHYGWPHGFHIDIWCIIIIQLLIIAALGAFYCQEYCICSHCKNNEVQDSAKVKDLNPSSTTAEGSQGLKEKMNMFSCNIVVSWVASEPCYHEIKRILSESFCQILHSPEQSSSFVDASLLGVWMRWDLGQVLNRRGLQKFNSSMFFG